MKVIFGLLLLIHALIHVMGFVKAYHIAEISQMSQRISKLFGILWLSNALLFLTASLLFFYKHKYWFVFAIIAVVASQLLIVIYWKDAKFGTIPNIIILLVGISAFGSYQFNAMVEKETNNLLENIKHTNSEHPITEESISNLPSIIQKWIQYTGLIEKNNISLVTLKQKGNMRTKPNSKWMPFEATQYFDVTDPAFVWTTEVNTIPKMVGRDKLVKGEGEMLIKLESLIPVVNEGGNEKVNSGTMLRYLAEICWFPSGVLNNYIKWSAIDDTSAKATFTYNNTSVSGIFYFTEEGKLLSFEANRYYGGGKDAKLEKWCIETQEFKTFSGLSIPNKCKVIWKLKEGDFHWLDLEITTINFT